MIKYVDIITLEHIMRSSVFYFNRTYAYYDKLPRSGYIGFRMLKG